jgi:hypothetical protein
LLRNRCDYPPLEAGQAKVSFVLCRWVAPQAEWPQKRRVRMRHSIGKHAREKEMPGPQCEQMGRRGRIHVATSAAQRPDSRAAWHGESWRRNTDWRNVTQSRDRANVLWHMAGLPFCARARSTAEFEVPERRSSKWEHLIRPCADGRWCRPHTRAIASSSSGKHVRLLPTHRATDRYKGLHLCDVSSPMEVGVPPGARARPRRPPHQDIAGPPPPASMRI